MKLFLENIGRIGKASVEINAITVIAGVNNSGKSTVGRSLFAVFNSFYNIREQINRERLQNIENLIGMMYRNVTNRWKQRLGIGIIAKNIIEQIDICKNSRNEIKDIILNSILQHDPDFEKYVNDRDVEELISRIGEGLEIPDMDIFKCIFRTESPPFTAK